MPGISDNATHGDLLCDKGWRKGELFSRGEGNLFLAEKRFPSPLKLPPSFQKPLICCFAPQGNPCLRDAPRPKKSREKCLRERLFCQ
ncbi:hypothetical protein DESPIGER_1844 [Desulfovibrio piger]|uniref:Uncharacterized protein n=1 Tax=Desulfovibrio piger TaxID=901 RepID=A0A1K1LG28_9BACT|nr:hypothetical protein DESPIGER_1844 [Desulfovibrio piger]